MAKLLVIDDKPNIQRVLKMILERQGYSVDTASSGTEGLNRIVTESPDLVVSDVRMDDMDGTELHRLVRERGLDVPFIFMTAFGSVRDAVAAIKGGAVDYLTKPIDYTHLQRTIELLLDRERERGLNGPDARLVGSSGAMQKLRSRITVVAASSATVLITGESGTGKELVARAIVEQSRRRERPFVALNCSALSLTLLESELFGHEKGSFTGALERKKGLFEIADGGTLFLDEVSELDPSVQVKLLRVLQERSFIRVGGTEPVKVDVRLIAATNRNLEVLVGDRKFREDLYYRLNVIPISVPSLRERLEDITELARHFVDRVCRREQIPQPAFSPDFVPALVSRSWPGNVRQLENLIERILVLYRPDLLEKSHVDAEFAPVRIMPRSSVRDRIVEALRLCGGNKSEAAKVLDMPRRTLYYKLEHYQIDKTEYSDA